MVVGTAAATTTTTSTTFLSQNFRQDGRLRRRRPRLFYHKIFGYLAATAALAMGCGGRSERQQGTCNVTMNPIKPLNFTGDKREEQHTAKRTREHTPPLGKGQTCTVDDLAYAPMTRLRACVRALVTVAFTIYKWHERRC